MIVACTGAELTKFRGSPVSINHKIQDLKRITDDLRHQGIEVQPLTDAIKSLEKQAENIEEIESSIEAIRAEIINPVKNEISTGHKLSRLGYYVGLGGFILAALSISISFFFEPNLVEIQRLQNRLESAIAALSDSHLNSIDPLELSEGRLENDQRHALNEIGLRLRRLETALLPPEQFVVQPGAILIEPLVSSSIETDGETVIELKYSDVDIDFFAGTPCVRFEISINRARIGSAGLRSGEQFMLISERVSTTQTSDRFQIEFRRFDRDGVNLCEGEVFGVFDAVFLVRSIETTSPIGRDSGDHRSAVVLVVEE